MVEPKHDPLDPLESAFQTGTPSTGQPAVAGTPPTEIFHGAPIEEGEVPVYQEPLGPPPPPPPISPLQKLLRFGLLGGGILLVILLIYLGYRWLTDRGAIGGPAQLTYWILWEEPAILQSLIDEYQQQHPGIKIKLDNPTPDLYRERLHNFIAQGKEPDLFRFHNTWVPMLQQELASLPPEIMSEEEFKNTFYPIMLQDLKVGNAIKGIPLMYEGLVVYYNVDILAAAGYNAPADNWDDFLLQAQALTTKDPNGLIVTAGTAVGRADNVEHFSDLLGLLFLQNGANPGLPASEAGVQALKFYHLFSAQPDAVWPGPQPGFENDIRAFAAGKVAMIFAPSWEVLVIQALLSQAGNPEFNYRTAPVPQIRAPNVKPVTWASYWVEGVNRKSTHQQQAWEFLKFLVQKQSLEKFFQLASQVRPFGEPYSRKDMQNLLTDHQYLGALIKQAEIAQSFYMASRTFDKGLNDQIVQYFRDAVNNVVINGDSPENALSTAQQGVQQKLKQFNVKVQ